MNEEKNKDAFLRKMNSINILNAKMEKRCKYVWAGDRRVVLGGSATELTKCERPRAPLRRSSEGSYALRRKSSSSSNAADDPTSSDPSTSCTASSSSSSSESELLVFSTILGIPTILKGWNIIRLAEFITPLATLSGCNDESETCNYCRLSESSDSSECRDSTDGERSTSSSEGNEARRPRRLMRALSEDCYPPSKTRPLRRTSPGEYLRHKRIQMEKLRNERLHSPGRTGGITFQRCDSDPRLHLKKSEDISPNRTLTYASPTRNRIRQPHSRNESELMVILPIVQSPEISSNEEAHRPRRSPLAKNVSERSHRQDSQSAVVWSADDSTPFLECGGVVFRCAVCESDLPFTNCVLCEAETKGQFFDTAQDISASAPEFSDEQPQTLNSTDEATFNDDRNSEIERVGVDSQSSEEKKELEEFYDAQTPAETQLSLNKRVFRGQEKQWTSQGAIHKSFNYEEIPASKRRNSMLRKYNSEPVPETEIEEGYIPSKSQADAPISHSPKKPTSDEQSVSSCQSCEVTEDESKKENSKDRCLSSDVATQEKNKSKSPVFLKPEFVFEPEIIHKANPLVDEAEVDVVPSAVGVFRRLSEDEFISTLNIHEAARKGDLHVVKLLCKKDCKQMETVDERGWTPIHLAAAHGHSEVVKYLAAEGAHLAALDPSSYTALHLSAMNGHKNCVEVLLPMGVDIDSITAEGFTPLHLAVMNNHLDCIQTLLRWGSSMDKRDALGRSVYEMVEEYNLEDVAALLRRFHKKMHNFKHVLDMIQKSSKSSFYAVKFLFSLGMRTEVPQKFPKRLWTFLHRLLKKAVQNEGAASVLIAIVSEGPCIVCPGSIYYW
ncbi:ankyrin repeat, PH and SEC7 domain containing protein secG [Caerostris extrusa]|uniref:Ankyrin repeat, PH and SEC7 domain containing protein secG n=1 Tax=Caerostris extrusa TaxID=172846 RepID=A0AAV4W7T3_CAEEX|nr:ankyrin repeat, PH and SEC7 domain containing protein secG [Caerostris extrusa]